MPATFPAVELTSARYTGVLKDENGGVVPDSSVDSITLTLYDAVTKSIINERDKQPALNVNNVTLDGAGNLAWLLQPADNVIVTDRRQVDVSTPLTEIHKAVFDVRWSGSKRLLHEVWIKVTNIEKVTS